MLGGSAPQSSPHSRVSVPDPPGPGLKGPAPLSRSGATLLRSPLLCHPDPCGVAPSPWAVGEKDDPLQDLGLYLILSSH